MKHSTPRRYSWILGVRTGLLQRIPLFARVQRRIGILRLGLYTGVVCPWKAPFGRRSTNLPAANYAAFLCVFKCSTNFRITWLRSSCALLNLRNVSLGFVNFLLSISTIESVPAFNRSWSCWHSEQIALKRSFLMWNWGGIDWICHSGQGGKTCEKCQSR